MRRLFRQIRVVKIEIANAAAVGEGRPVRRSLVTGAKDRGSVFRREISRYSSRNYKGFFTPCAERAAQGIDYAPFDFVHDFVRKILKSQRARVFSKLMSKRCLHVKNRDFNLLMIFTGARERRSLPALELGTVWQADQCGRFFGATTSAIDFSIRPRSLLVERTAVVSFSKAARITSRLRRNE